MEQPTQLQIRVEARKRGRQCAEDVKQLLEWDGLSDDYKDAFREAFAKKELQRDPSSDAPSLKSLEATAMPFGKHEGKRFADIPLEYLTWLCESQEEFYRRLRQY